MGGTWDWPGSRWWRVDVHAHSPASYDFRDSSMEDEGIWRQWIAAARDASLDAIAVTDHNTAEAVAHIQDDLANVERAPTVFPAVEITATDGTHLLIVLSPDSSQQHVESILSSSGIAVDQFGRHDARSNRSVEQIISEFGEENVVVGAHVNSKHGLLRLDGGQRIDVLRNRRLAAVEVNPCEAVEDRWLDGLIPQVGRRLSRVWGSDGHSLDDLGRRFTWIKMSQPNLEGLRLALQDGASSLYPTVQDDKYDPNSHADLAIESVTVYDGKFMGQSQPITFHFNPWLNAIIGGRGTGKSSLVDFCRRTLRREGELDDRRSEEEGSLRHLFDRRMRVPESRTSEGLLTSQTKVEMVYRRSGDRFVVSWDQGGKSHPIALLRGSERIPEEGVIRERFPVRMYRQKQLFALAQDPNALLKVIDDTATVRRVEIDRTMERLEARYLALRAQARSASQQADDLPARRASLTDVKRKLDILQLGGHTEAVQTYRRRRQQDEAWATVLREASTGVSDVSRAVKELSVSDLALDDAAVEEPETASLKRAHEALQTAVRDLRSEATELVEGAGLQIDRIRTGDYASQWRAVVETSEKGFHEAFDQLAEQGISDPDQYGELLEQSTNLLKEIGILEGERERSIRLACEAEDVLREYRNEREELSQRRERFVQESSNDTIEIQVSSLSDSVNLAEELTQILGIDRFRSDRDSIARRIRPEGDQSWTWELLDEIVDEIRKFILGESQSWNSEDYRFETSLARVRPEQVDRLALYVPGDNVSVQFRDGEESDWQSLSQGSPGQQTAALLAFVLGYGSEPMILDQPEDDLDNTLIYQLLVRRLRETKSNRQVIVVTHNPNIVVHGDAELVLSLKAANSRSDIACQGGLQERLVRDEICRVMEGGREAFETRYQRIIPPTD